MAGVMLVDDHNLFREGLKFLLSQIKNIEFAGEASNGLEFINQLNADKLPDIVLLDISMPVMNGIDACFEALKRYPGLKIIALSMNNEPEYYMKMIQAGAKGFVQKQAGKAELEEAITEVLSGGNYFPEEMLRNIIFKLGQENDDTNEAKKHHLNLKELEVLKYICQGLTNIEIAEKMFLSPKTIEGYRASLLSKTETRNSAHLVMYCIKSGIIKF